MPQQFFLFRHALARLPGQLYGKEMFSATILAEGMPATERMAKYLAQQSLDALYVSPFKRCQQTARLMEPILQKSFITDKRLGEHSYEEGDILGESFAQFQQRLAALADNLLAQSYQSVALCTHGSVIAGLSSLLRSQPFTLAQKLDYPLTGVLACVNVGGGGEGVKYIDFNNDIPMR